MRFIVSKILTDADVQLRNQSTENSFLVDKKTVVFDGVEYCLHYGSVVVSEGKELYVNENSVSDEKFDNQFEREWNLKQEGVPASDGKRYLLKVPPGYYPNDTKMFEQYNNCIVSLRAVDSIHVERPTEGGLYYNKELDVPLHFSSGDFVKYTKTEETIVETEKNVSDRKSKLDELIDYGLRYTEDITSLNENADAIFKDDVGDLYLRFKNDVRVLLEKPENGKDGVDGKDGLPGANGRDGLEGSKGPKGDKGDRGSEGKQGKEGKEGRKGKDGPKGLKGDKGDRGPEGKEGKQGKEGPKGSKGDKGDKGDRGEKGDFGGPQGHKGDKGDRGEKGEKGDMGPPGERGEKGDTPSIDALLTQLSLRINQDLSSYKMLMSKELYKLSSRMPGPGSHGGGSTKLMDNDDVEFKRINTVADRSVLIFDPAKKKFVATNIDEIIGEITTSVEMQYNKLIDVSGSYTYIGEADPGSSAAAAVWRIKRVEVAGDDTNILWASGTSNFDKIWNNRAAFVYS